jgi:hypothetical protein
MNFGYFTLFIAIVISCVVEFYSIAGLVAIFSAAPLPVIIMGVALGIGKLTATVWLKLNWDRASLAYKLYLVPAVGLLMFLTSIGCFGFLSKAHSDASQVSGDVQAKIAIYDEKIKTEKENIETARRALKQMDEGVDQVLGRSTSETGADRAVALRRSQQKERGRLLAEISQSQKLISELNDARAPIAAEVRKVEAEVGPIKYIAALVYGDNTDANILESAVRWVIILIVIVLDPLALVLLLAGQQTLKWEKQRLFDLLKLPEPKPEPELNLQAVNQMLAAAAVIPKPVEPVVQDPHPKGWMFTPGTPPVPEKSIIGQHPYLLEPFVHFKDLEPMVYRPEPVAELESSDDEDETDPKIKEAIKQWKRANPDATIKHQRNLLARGEIDELPWIQYHRQPISSFGTEFPPNPAKGDSFVRVDRTPSVLYKFNNRRWIEVDKNTTDNYTYDMAYIDHLIEMIGKGTYDADLLTDAEQLQVAIRLQTNPTTNT